MTTQPSGPYRNVKITPTPDGSWQFYCPACGKTLESGWWRYSDAYEAACRHCARFCVPRLRLAGKQPCPGCRGYGYAEQAGHADPCRTCSRTGVIDLYLPPGQEDRR